MWSNDEDDLQISLVDQPIPSEDDWEDGFLPSQDLPREEGVFQREEALMQDQEEEGSSDECGNEFNSYFAYLQSHPSKPTIYEDTIGTIRQSFEQLFRLVEERQPSHPSQDQLKADVACFWRMFPYEFSQESLKRLLNSIARMLRLQPSNYSDYGCESYLHYLQTQNTLPIGQDNCAATQRSVEMLGTYYEQCLEDFFSEIREILQDYDIDLREDVETVSDEYRGKYSIRAKMLSRVLQWLNASVNEAQQIDVVQTTSKPTKETSTTESLGENTRSNAVSLAQQLIKTMNGIGMSSIVCADDGVDDRDVSTDEDENYSQAIDFTGTYAGREIIGRLYDATDPAFKATKYALEEFDRHQNVIRLMMLHNFMFNDPTQKDPIPMKVLVLLRPTYTLLEFLEIMSSYGPARCLVTIFRQLLLLLDVIHSHDFVLGEMNPTTFWIDLFDAPARDEQEKLWDFEKNNLPVKKAREVILKVQDFSCCQPRLCKGGVNTWVMSKGLLDPQAYQDAYEQILLTATSDTKSLAFVYAYMDMLVSQGRADAMKVAQNRTQRTEVQIGERISADCANRLNNLMWNIMDGNITEKAAKQHCFFFNEAETLAFFIKLVARVPATNYELQSTFDGEPKKSKSTKHIETDNCWRKFICLDTDSKGNPTWFDRLGISVLKYVESINNNSSASRNSRRLNDGEGERSTSSATASGLKPMTIIQSQTFYKQDSVYGLIKLIRNVYHHPDFSVVLDGDFRDQQPHHSDHINYDAVVDGKYQYDKKKREMAVETMNLKVELGKRPEQFMRYFLHRYPALMTITHCLVHQNGLIDGFTKIENLKLYETLYTISDVNEINSRVSETQRINFTKRQFE